MNDLQVAAYLDRGLSLSDRDKVEAHLADCAECRDNLLEAQKLVKKVRRPRRALVGILAVAAAVAFVVLRGPNPLSDAGLSGAPARNGETLLPIVAYGPMGNVRQTALRFVWAPVKDAMTYRLTLSHANAEPVWSKSSIDTVAILPDSVVLQVGERYYWVADALLRDGSNRSTGLREFGPVR